MAEIANFLTKIGRKCRACREVAGMIINQLAKSHDGLVWKSQNFGGF